MGISLVGKMDFQDGLLDDEDVNGINVRVNPPPEGKQLSLEEAKGITKNILDNRCSPKAQCCV